MMGIKKSLGGEDIDVQDKREDLGQDTEQDEQCDHAAAQQIVPARIEPPVLRRCTSH